MENKETLEEAAERWNEKQTTLEFGKPHNAPNRIKAFIEGAKWQQERMYSEEEVLKLLKKFDKHTLELQFLKLGNRLDVVDWFEQVKKK